MLTAGVMGYFPRAPFVYECCFEPVRTAICTVKHRGLQSESTFAFLIGREGTDKALEKKAF